MTMQSLCHCGAAVHTNEDGFSRDMCEDCSLYRCDIEPGCVKLKQPEHEYAPPAASQGLREALEKRLETLPVMRHENGYPVQALPKAELLDLLAMYSAEEKS